MARIDQLVEQVPDPQLRADLAHALLELRQRRTFGLVFEQHIPETTLLHTTELRVGQIVHYRRDPNSQQWRIARLTARTARIEPLHPRPGTPIKVSRSDLFAVKRFGDPIYPTLTPLGETRRHSSRPTHIIIEGENYHALQLLLYLHDTQVDCIYIDPPYNAGSRDWKYNNRFVDKKDKWRHSKWLSMMDRRLRLANPENS